MNAFVFAGPTIQAADIAAVCDAVVLPPVAMGDVYRIGAQRPRAIGIIDGYFDGVPSVWHKEILWAMAEGITVFGASSMGALRAVELHPFGMHGVGKIFEAYRDGTLEDDDEVAMQHGPCETGYVTLSEPMVNIRATLEEALRRKVLTTGTAAQLTALAKSLFYPERNWDAVLALGKAQKLAPGELHALEASLPDCRVDQKRNDALAMLKVMAEFLASGAERTKVAFYLEWSVMWDQAVQAPNKVVQAEANAASAIVDELRLDPDHFHRIRRRAIARLMAERAFDRCGPPTDKRALRQAVTRFRTERQLITRAALCDWLTRNDLDDDAFERLIEEELRLMAIGSSFGEALDRHMLAELRLTGSYPELAERARRKQQILEQLGMANPEPGDLGAIALQLRSWYFETRLERPMPDDVDQFIQDAGYPDRDRFDRMLAREYLFWREAARNNTDAGAG